MKHWIFLVIILMTSCISYDKSDKDIDVDQNNKDIEVSDVLPDLSPEDIDSNEHVTLNTSKVVLRTVNKSFNEDLETPKEITSHNIVLSKGVCYLIEADSVIRIIDDKGQRMFVLTGNNSLRVYKNTATLPSKIKIGNDIYTVTIKELTP